MPPVLGQPTLLYRGGGRTGTLPTVIVDVTNTAYFTIDVRGATGTLTLESLLGDGTGAEALPYSLSADLPTTTDDLEFTGGERIYCTTAWAQVRITGSVDTGALQLVYTGWPALPPGAAMPVNLAQGDGLAGPLNPIPVSVTPSVP